MTGVSVFAVDPGSTTGWAFAKNVDMSTIPHHDADIDIVGAQMAGDPNLVAWDLWRIIKQVWPCAVVIEDFVPQKLDKSREFLSPVRVTEKLDWILWRNEKRHWRQMPSLAKRTITDQYMREIGIWIPGQEHANDAQRHVLTYLRMIKQHPERHGQIISPRMLEVRS